MFQNQHIIEELFLTKNLLKKVSDKKIFWEFKLTVANYEILKLILKEDKCTISKLQKKIPETLSSLTQKTNKLEKLGYLKKIKDDKDPRKKILRISKKGERVVKKVEKKIEIVSSFVFKKYSQKDKVVFLKILKNFNQKIDKKIK